MEAPSTPAPRALRYAELGRTLAKLGGPAYVESASALAPIEPAVALPISEIPLWPSGPVALRGDDLARALSAFRRAPPDSAAD